LLSFPVVVAAAGHGGELKSPQGFTITYPEGWQPAPKAQVEQLAGKLAGLAALIRAPSRDNFSDHLFVLIKPIPPGFDKLDAENRIVAIEAMSADPEAVPSSATDMERKRQEVAGTTAVIVSYEVIPRHTTISMRTWHIYVPGKDRVYEFYCTALKSHWAAEEPIFREMIMSIHLGVASAPATGSQAAEQEPADPEQAKRDEELVTLHNQAKFKELLGTASKIDRAAYADSYRPGKEIAGVKTLEDFPERGLRYRLRMSPDATASKPNKLIVWLHPTGTQASHGMNDTVEAMAPVFIKRGYALVVFTQKNYANWSNGIDVPNLFVSLKEIGKIPGIDARKPILFGFSAGGQEALWLWMIDPGRFGGMVIDAAYPVTQTQLGYDVHHSPPLPRDAAVKTSPVLALVGLQDYGAKVWRRVESSWWRAGVPLDVIYIPDRQHEWLFDNARTKQLDQWLSQVAGGKLPGRHTEKADVPPKK